MAAGRGKQKKKRKGRNHIKHTLEERHRLGLSAKARAEARKKKA